MKKGLFLVASGLILISCAITTTEAVWKTTPEIQQTSYENAWAIIVGAVTEQFDLEVVDGNSGYLRSIWKVKTNFMGDPQSRTRVICRVVSREPLQFKIKAEKQEISALTDEWINVGNDEVVDGLLLEELRARLP